MRRLWLALLLLPLPAGCETPRGAAVVRGEAAVAAAGEAPGPIRPRADSGSGTGDAVVARVGGSEIRRSDIGEFVIRVFPDQAEAALVQLVDERIVRAETRQFDITLPDGALDAALRAEVAEKERWTKVNFGSEETWAGYLSLRYGRELDEVLTDHRRLLEVQLLLRRLIRYRQLLEHRVEIREAAFGDEATAARAAAAVRAGADLGVLARAQGLPGGEPRPPLSRDELEPGETGTGIWALAPGQVAGPFATGEGGDRRWLVVKMVRRLPGREATWSEVRDRVESGLEDRPLEKWEYLRWARRARKAYGLSGPGWGG